MCVHVCVCLPMQLTCYNNDNNTDQYHSTEQASPQGNPVRPLHNATQTITIRPHDQGQNIHAYLEV